MSREKSTPEELANSRDSRVAAKRLDSHERYLNLLRVADRVRQDNGFQEGLAEQIEVAQNEMDAFVSKAGGRIVGRKRPTGVAVKVRPATCGIYLDECGAHTLSAKGEFEAFCLAAVIVPDGDYSKFDAEWKAWKQSNLGSAAKVAHEPDVRKGRGPFWLKGSKAKRQLVIKSLGKKIEALDFTAVVCVLNRPEYVKKYGEAAIDESLPPHVYLMMLHFLMERVVMVLDKYFGSVRAQLVAESRGFLEDAWLQYEFARLQIDGTAYISSAWFRHQLCPGVIFQGKGENNSGLQLADLLARPCGEKVLDPDSTPDRWEEFRPKLCPDQGETAHSILGLKIIPWADEYDGVWKAEGAAEATPSADQVKT